MIVGRPDRGSEYWLGGDSLFEYQKEITAQCTSQCVENVPRGSSIIDELVLGMGWGTQGDSRGDFVSTAMVNLSTPADWNLNRQ